MAREGLFLMVGTAGITAGAKQIRDGRELEIKTFLTEQNPMRSFETTPVSPAEHQEFYDAISSGVYHAQHSGYQVSGLLTAGVGFVCLMYALWNITRHRL